MSAPFPPPQPPGPPLPQGRPTQGPPPQVPPPPPGASAPPPSRRGSGALIALGVTAGALLLVNLGLGAVALGLQLQGSTAAPGPTPSTSATPTPSPTPTPAHDLDGVPVFVLSGNEVGAPLAEGRSVYATMTNAGAQAMSVFYDLTLLDAEGGIIARETTVADILPGQETMLHWILQPDLPAAAEIRIEETDSATGTAPVSGAITLESMNVDEYGLDGLSDPELGIRADVRLNSTLSAPVESGAVELYIVGEADGRMVAVGDCWDFDEVPANATFDAGTCTIIGSSYVPEDLSTIEFRAVPAFLF